MLRVGSWFLWNGSNCMVFDVSSIQIEICIQIKNPQRQNSGSEQRQRLLNGLTIAAKIARMA